MTETARMQEIKTELQRMEEDETYCCQPCDETWDALYARKLTLDAEFKAHETRECRPCTEVQAALDARRRALCAEWYALQDEDGDVLVLDGDGDGGR